ncbi:NAD(P)H-hydrate dehydratase [Sulfidibacter corallicola]|uniref:Bifunctional NAD(P)H-hydrate repair enzyme n=1 Tax=Sulfidibacter corallicola TaxID=2818388 RepID=A0A8A4TUN8_SULCO|nr:NAD(P)H-hydrate dehydratase [Sulfidibacter corallicola]QTD53230.1 NAD(P)H-hydrate dehydratase [Sulfidibacter corallicola]
MKAIVSASEMAAADRYTIERLGVPGIELMERAARACVGELMEELRPDSLVTVLAGPGNNGGDGLAIARLLHGEGVTVRVFLLQDGETYRGDAALNHQRLRDLAVDISVIEDPATFGLPLGCDWVVDALFGTGLSRPITGGLANLIERLNVSGLRVLAVDIPSGLSGDHGRVDGPAVRARLTVTFQCLKFAHVVTPACLSCGDVRVHDIGISFSDEARTGSWLVEGRDFQRPTRDVEGHKGRYGYLGVVGGFAGMAGAASLAARAALRFGAGKVRVLTDQPAYFGQPGSVMVDHVDRWKQVGDFDALVIGPGLSRAEAAWSHLRQWDLRDRSIVWDADGLHLLAAERLFPGKDWVMTPHPGEAAVLLGTTAGEVQRDRLAAIRALAKAFPGGWLLLKGFRTLVLSPGGELFVCGTGNVALATAGSGDVLSGMIGAMLAQGCAMEEAVLSACLRHGLAADRWVRHHPDYSMIAEDIIEDLKY